MPTTPPEPTGGHRPVPRSRRRPRYAARSGRPHRPVATRTSPEPRRSWLWPAADRAWRLLVLAAAGYAVFFVLGRVQLIAAAVFLGLVLTSILRPLTELLARRVPRPLAVLIALVGSIILVAALLSLVGEVVAGESAKLGREFSGGITRIEQFLEKPPFRISPATITSLRAKLNAFIAAHRSALISTAVSAGGRLVEVATGGALAVFCSVFFLYSGERMWDWFERQLTERVRSPWSRAARTAWSTFAGYTRGIVIVAASNAILVGIALYALRVPLALPLTVLEFLATFIPLVGSPVALAIASVVALAGRGPVTAIIVLALIVIIGQIEGHVLHPLVMSWAVQLHPVVVAFSVLAGGIFAGVIGAAVAVPMVSVAWAVFRELRSEPL